MKLPPGSHYQRLMEENAELRGERDRLAAAVQRVRELHQGWHTCDNGRGGFTDFREDEPGLGACPTLAALDGVQDDTGEVG